MKHNLTPEQRRLLIVWSAEGLRLKEINERAAKEDPPFQVKWHQLKHVRTRQEKTFGELRGEFEAEASAVGLANRLVRIRELSELVDKHLALIKARGEEMANEIAGGDLGLMARDYKGKNADTPIYKYDAALIREIRGLFDDIAREVGDRRTNVDLGGSGELVLKVQYGDDGSQKPDNPTTAPAREANPVSE